jgi:hypothetical protein
MSTNNFARSDLQNIHHLVQYSALVYPKEMVIATLRDFFSKDSYYHYTKDEYGFAKTVDHTDLPLTAGLYDNATTRIFIGENYRYDGIHYPAILVKSNGARYVPISANREAGAPLYETTVYEDGYGNHKTIYTPRAFLFAGIWEGSVTIDIITRSLRSRDDLAELVGICFADIMFETMRNAGIVVKPPNIGAPSESEDRNDKLFRQSITIDIRTEWRREIPVSSIIDRILFVTELVNIENPEAPTDPNFSIYTDISLTDNIINNL